MKFCEMLKLSGQVEWPSGVAKWNDQVEWASGVVKWSGCRDVYASRD